MTEDRGRMTEGGGQRAEDGGRRAEGGGTHREPHALHLRSEGRRGFTLLEILIAIFILALVVSALFGAFSGTFRVVNETEAREEIYAAARVALARISEDLSSACGGATGAVFVGEDRRVDDRSADTLRFLSYAHISFKGGRQVEGPAEICYYTEYKEKTGDFDLYRSDVLDYLTDPEGEPGGLRLCEGLKWLDFIYYDERGDAHDSWDATRDRGKRGVPARVEITIAFENGMDPEHPFQFRTGVALPPVP